MVLRKGGGGGGGGGVEVEYFVGRMEFHMLDLSGKNPLGMGL